LIQTIVDPQHVSPLSGKRSTTMFCMCPTQVTPELYLAITGKLRDFQRTIRQQIPKRSRGSKPRVDRLWMGALVVV
jgi:hypothetical protein